MSMEFDLESKGHRALLRNRAWEQGYRLEKAWRDGFCRILKASMAGHEVDFIWSDRCRVWFPEGSQPDDARAALKERNRKEHAKARFDESFSKSRGESFKVIKLTTFEERNLDWKLGLGPCGRKVLGLKVIKGTEFLTILQWCEDNPGLPDEFEYPLSRFKALRFYRTDTPEVPPPQQP